MTANDKEFFTTIHPTPHALQFPPNEETQIPTAYPINSGNKVASSFMLSEELATATATAGDTSLSNPSSSASSVKSFQNNLRGRSKADDMTINSLVARLRMNLTRSPSRDKPNTRSASPHGPPLSRPPSTLSQSATTAKQKRPVKRPVKTYGRHSNDWLFGGFSFRESLFGIDPE